LAFLTWVSDSPALALIVEELDEGDDICDGEDVCEGDVICWLFGAELGAF
jgi:hypothetical protein